MPYQKIKCHLSMCNCGNNPLSYGQTCVFSASPAPVRSCEDRYLLTRPSTSRRNIRRAHYSSFWFLSCSFYSSTLVALCPAQQQKASIKQRPVCCWQLQPQAIPAPPRLFLQVLLAFSGTWSTRTVKMAGIHSSVPSSASRRDG